jgi:hypothetical protein
MADAIKKPETAVSLAVAATLVATAGFFYWRMKSVEERVDGVDKGLSAMLLKVPDLKLMREHVDTLVKAVQEKNVDIAEQNSTIDEIYERLDYQQNVLDAICAALAESGAEIELPHPPGRNGQRSRKSIRNHNNNRANNRRPRQTAPSRRERETEDEDDDDEDLASVVASVNRQRGRG